MTHRSALAPLRWACCSLALTVLLSGPIRADEIVEVGGLPFPVEELRPVADGSVKVAVRGRTHLVAPERLEEFVVREWLDPAPDRLPFELGEVQRFALARLVDGHLEHALLAMITLLERLPFEDARAALSTLPEGQNTTALLKQLLLRASDQQLAISDSLLAFISLQVLQQDAEWGRTRIISLIYRLGDSFKSALREEFAQAVGALRWSDAQQLVTLSEQLFGEDEQFTRTLRVTWLAVRSIVEDVDRGELDRLFALAEGSGASDEVRTLLMSFVVGTLHERAEKAIDEGEAGRAVGLLARVPLERRSDRTHELLYRALVELAPSDSSPLKYHEIEQYLQSVAVKDARIATLLAARFEDQIRYLIDQDRAEEVEYYLRRLVDLRPDPNAQNDRMRALLARSYLALERPGSAQRILAQMHTGLTFGERVRINITRFLHDRTTLVVLAVMALVAVLVLLDRMFGASRRLGEAFAGRAPEPEFEPEEPVEPFVEPTFGRAAFRGANPAMQEYLRCLGVLGLDSNADIGSIKRAYRNLVKEVHPDAGAHHDEAASERFIELTRAYDRVLELRRDLGLKS